MHWQKKLKRKYPSRFLRPSSTKKKNHNVRIWHRQILCRVKSSIYYLALSDVVLNIRCTSDLSG